MAVKQRAMATAEKAERRQAILDAAESLYLDHPDRIANVAEVASTAGLAKGTVYLYFPSKEEMLLSLHERNVGRFFSELVRALETRESIGFDEIFEVTRTNILRPPGYLPLTSRCFGLMDREIPLDTAIAFKMRVGQALATAGPLLERHFAALRAGDGITLLLQSYGLIVGMWQLMHPNERFGAAMDQPGLRMFKRDYEREVEKALRALWSGMIARNESASPAKEPAARRRTK